VHLDSEVGLIGWLGTWCIQNH